MFDTAVNFMTRNQRNKNQAGNTTLESRKPSAELPNVDLTNFKNMSSDEGKLSVEIQKLELEKSKLAFEKDKLLVSSLIEDFKARWQELLNFENENSRWQTIYVTALILVISWVLSNSGETGRYKSIRGIFEGDNSYLLISLALINAIYTLAMAYKGYQIQEIAQYLYVNIGSKISDRIPAEFNSWERWRRNETGTPKLIRTFFYIIIGVLPTAVSTTILSLFYFYRYPVNDSNEWLNAFFYLASVFVLISLLIAFYTTTMNNKWESILARETADSKDQNPNAGS